MNGNVTLETTHKNNGHGQVVNQLVLPTSIK